MTNVQQAPSHRLREFTGFVCLACAFALLFALASFDPLDPSWNTVTGRRPAANKIGVAGAWVSDLLFQSFGLASWLLPALLAWIGIRWLRHHPLTSPVVRMAGYALLVISAAAALELMHADQILHTSFAAGGRCRASTETSGTRVDWTSS